jgi:anti-sigma factor RsiW
MNCRDVRRCVHAFIHEELEPQQLVLLEGHIEECEECRQAVEFERWFRLQLQESVGSTTPPRGLAERVHKSLQRDDRTRQLQKVAQRAGVSMALVACVAAALVLPEWLEPAPTSSVVASGRPVIDYVAERHARSLPLEVAGSDAGNVSRWFRDKVDFAVRPPLFGSEQVQLLGGRLTHVGDYQAAHLSYERNGRPITVVVFPDGQMSMGSARQLRAGTHTVYVGQSRGYNVAVWRSGGMAYAVSSDLDQRSMVRLVSSVR